MCLFKSLGKSKVEISAYRQFATSVEVKKWAETNYASFLGNTDTEIYRKVYEYTGSWYKPINAFLRRAPLINTPEFDSWWPDYENEVRKEYKFYMGAGASMAEFKFDEADYMELQSLDARKKADAKKINTLLHEYRLTEGIVVYRLVNKDYLKNLSPTGKLDKGIIIKDKAFLSTTLLPEGMDSVKEKYTYPYMECAILKIRVPKGSFGAYVSQDGYMGNILREYEFLLPPSTALQVIKVHRMALPMIIECEAITE